MNKINYHPRENTIITEGIFGYLNAERNGVTALTCFSSLVKAHTYKWLTSLNPVIVFDNDFAGYLGAGRMIKNISNARVVAPGLEADEISAKEWTKIKNGDIVSTRDLDRLAKLSGNVSKFWSKI